MRMPQTYSVSHTENWPDICSPLLPQVGHMDVWNTDCISASHLGSALNGRRNVKPNVNHRGKVGLVLLVWKRLDLSCHKKAAEEVSEQQVLGGETGLC